jgi:hypothetical protein
LWREIKKGTEEGIHIPCLVWGFEGETKRQIMINGEDLFFLLLRTQFPLNYHPSSRELISGSWPSKLPFPPKLQFLQNKQKISKLVSINSHSLLSITPNQTSCEGIG